MTKSVLFPLLASGLLAVPCKGLAQSSGSKLLTVDMAQAMAQAAIAKCRADGFKITVLIVDGLNTTKIMVRDDGATAATTEVARMKATSVMLYDRPSGPRADLPPGAPVPAPTIPGTIIAVGGVPIRAGDTTIGAIAVSGAPHGESDLGCANAGLAKFTERQK
jgi:uncharacterized protein GlcG (DUF336 family)